SAGRDWPDALVMTGTAAAWTELGSHDAFRSGAGSVGGRRGGDGTDRRAAARRPRGRRVGGRPRAGGDTRGDVAARRGGRRPPVRPDDRLRLPRRRPVGR